MVCIEHIITLYSVLSYKKLQTLTIYKIALKNHASKERGKGHSGYQRG
jgi:hypothetical protein